MDSISIALASKSTVSGLIKLMRPKQWVKNGFVIAPIIFAGDFLNVTAIGQVCLAMFFFCLASSTVYILNDIYDIDHDRKHPRKSKTRPLATGQVTITQALSLLFALLIILLWGYTLQPSVISVIACYILLNIAYTFALKHQPVIDIFTIAIGFVLRVYAGAVALNSPVTSWLFVTTLCLALYLAAIKRRQELRQTSQQGRKVLAKYSITLIDRYAEISATGALLFYSLFVITQHPNMIVTIPFVLYGLFRYWFIVETHEAGESPTDALLSDWQLMLTIALWVGTCMWTIWPAAV